MNDILLVIINMDNKCFDEEFDYKSLIDYIEQTRESRNIDYSLLTFFSSYEPYKSRDSIKKIISMRDGHDKMIFGKSYSKNNGYDTSFFARRDGKNKEELFDRIYDYYSSFIEVKSVLLMDDSLSDIIDVDSIFSDSECIKFFPILKSDDKKLKKTIY